MQPCAFRLMILISWQSVAAKLLLLVALGSVARAAEAADRQSDTAPEQGDAPYIDRLIDGGNLEPLTGSSDQQQRDTKGAPRSLVVELGGSIISPKSSVDGIDAGSLDNSQREAGISVSGRYQSGNLGLLGIDAQLHRGSELSSIAGSQNDSWNGSVTLTSRDFPLGKGWLADSAVGMTNTPAIALVRRQTRFYLPSMPILGGSVTFHAYRPFSEGAPMAVPEPVGSINLAIGEPGLLGGLRLSNFTGLSGLAVSAGGQLDLAPRWQAGMQTILIKDSRDPYEAVFETGDSTGRALLTSSRGVLGSLAYSRAALRVQANAIWSHRDRPGVVPGFDVEDGSAGGGWIDASYRSGRTQHSGGLYYFGPGLTWGTSALINNAFGGYYRFSASSQRWRWTFNLDAVDSVDSTARGGVIVNADVRRKISVSTAIGLNSTLRVTNGQTATQILGFVDFSSRLGSSRAEAGWSHDPISELYRLGFNQNWELPAWLPSGSRLSTQVAYEHRSQSLVLSDLPLGTKAQKANSFGAAVSVGATPFNGVSLDANLAYNSSGNSFATSVSGPVDLTGGALSYASSERGRAFTANFVATARISSSWSLSTSYTDTTSRVSSLFGLPGGALGPLGSAFPDGLDRRRLSYHLRAGYLTLRYSVAAGRPAGSLGLRQYPFGGTGNLEGRVYLDANDNDTREPAEVGAAGIVVILDGIQAVRTDQSGFYRFENVSDGTHRVTLNTDMLPLPWIIEAPASRGTGEPYQETVEIAVRSTTKLDISARRE